MAHIQLQDISLDYPIYGSNARSLKSSLINVATGGKLKKIHGSMMVEALQDLNFELNNGDRLGLIGHNGAGKTTLLKVLAQIYTPSKGKLHIQGEVNSLFDITMGFDFEATGYENIVLRGLLLGLSHREIAAIIPVVEEFAELGEFIKMPIKTYSSGMIVRLAFGIISNTPAEILLIDEAVNVGDTSFREKARQQMAALIHQSDIMVLSTHESEIMREFCNKALWLEHGKIKKLGATNEVLKEYEQAFKTSPPTSENK